MNKFGVYIGRFCPIHYGHQKIINKMIEVHGTSNCLLLIGSSSSPLSWRVMFNYTERKRWIESLYPNLKIIGIPDVQDDQIWLSMLNDYLNVSIGNATPVFYGGSQSDVEFLYDIGYPVNIVDRMELPVSGSQIRELLLRGDSINSQVSNTIESSVRETFHKKIVEIDAQRD